MTPYLKFYGLALLILMALTLAFWVLHIAVRVYFDKRNFDRRLEQRIREIDREMEKGK